MNDAESEIQSKRLKILTREEICNIFDLPDFTSDERDEYFSLTSLEKDFLANLRSISSKLYFILQTGYFKSRHQFFNFEFNQVKEDGEYILQKCFPEQKINLGKIKVVAKSTRLIHQNNILQIHNYCLCGESEREIIASKARNFAKISGKPIYIFREIVTFLQEKQIVLPGYSVLQEIVGQALVFEQDRLVELLKNNLASSQKEKLDVLLSNTQGLYEITQLKKEPKDFTLKEIKGEIERADQIREIYLFSQNLLPKFEISNESITYYASMVSYYSVYKLKRFDRWISRLYILCFVQQRYRRVNDNLINSLIYRLRLYTDQAKDDAKVRLSNLRLETNQDIGKVGQVLELLTDEQIPQELPFGMFQEKVFEIISRQAIRRVAGHITKEQKFDERFFRWEYLDKIARRFKVNLRPIFMTVDFSALPTNSDLLEAVRFLQDIFWKNKNFQKIPSKNFPIKFIPKKYKTYLIEKKTGNRTNQVIPDRYEFLVYQLLKDGFESGDVHCRDSLRFRSFEDDLLSDKEWENKTALINEANLPILNDPIETHLNELEELLESRLKEVNKRITFKENSHFIFTGRGKQSRWMLEYPNKMDDTNNPVFNSLTNNDISNILRFTHHKTGFINCFEHLLEKYIKSSVDEIIINACLIAWGTNIGLGKMGGISDISSQKLRTASDNFIRPETLTAANDLITNAIAEFPIFQNYNINKVVHSSSDGQKFETKFQTINARYSPKYFGLKKGVVSYTLVANHIPVNARIIGANEHESHYVFDLLFNNTTNIQPEIHSTDTGGTNQVNFALLHIFGYQFAPRFKDIYDAVTKSLYGFRHPSRYGDMPLKPIRKINTRLIISEWENIQKIILSLAYKATTQYIITGKLSSYLRKNKTKQAIWEYDNIIKSLYLLDYVDSPAIRQNVYQALNRGESYHQLRRAIAYANWGKLRYKSEYEQSIWNECSRLLTNCILYYNISILSNLLERKVLTDKDYDINRLKHISPIAWQHINFLGRYEFGRIEKPISIDKLVDEIKF
jgi:TnpA family transposase